jgi:glyoxylase-like metal-dependent hydrolase (beta-lactamase superfamily II)
MNKHIIINLFLLLTIYSVNAQMTDNIFSYKLGKAQITMLSEGQHPGNPDVLLIEKDGKFTKYAYNNPFATGTNCFLIQMDGKNVLIDAGYGRNLFNNLEALGLNADKIDYVLLTHLHGDHIGGMLRDGNIAFPNAEVYLDKREYDYWLKSTNGNAKQMLELYKNKLHQFTAQQILLKLNRDEVIPALKGIYAIAAYGHTPGHTAFLIKNNNEQLLVWGDLAHAMAVQMPHPEVAVTYDVEPKQAVRSREQILQYVAQFHIPIAGMHIAFPGIGMIEKIDMKSKSGGFNFEPFE